MNFQILSFRSTNHTAQKQNIEIADCLDAAIQQWLSTLLTQQMSATNYQKRVSHARLDE